MKFHTKLVAVFLCFALSFGCVSQEPQITPSLPINATGNASQQTIPQPNAVPSQVVQEPEAIINQNDCTSWLPNGTPTAEYPANRLYLSNATHSMSPFAEGGIYYMLAKVPASEIKIGDVVCWSPSFGEKLAEENVNLTEVAIKSALGIAVKVDLSYLGMFSGGVCHQVVWRNGTHFLTQGTNQVTNKVVDRLPPQTFSDNYRGKMVLDDFTQAQLYDFWKTNRQWLSAYVGVGVVQTWAWCDSGNICKEGC